MAVVLRLQGLNIEAGSEDIRRFFHGLHILEGGVHITGGTSGEAFIMFTTEKDGQLAMGKSGQLLRGSPIMLHGSSLTELKQAMELSLRREPQKATPTDLCSAVLQGYLAAIQRLQLKNQKKQCKSPQDLPALTKFGQDKTKVELVPVIERKVEERVKEPVRPHEDDRERRESNFCKPGYLRLYGLPNAVTKQEICDFLSGLCVVEVIVNTFQDQDRCCLVKMASLKEAQEGLKYSLKSLKDIDIKVRLAHERMWTNALMGHDTSPGSSKEKDRISPRRCSYKNSPTKRHQVLLRSPKRLRSESPPFGTEYCVMVKNLPTHITKTNLKQIFSCLTVPYNRVLHLLNPLGERTSTAFLIFTQAEEYTSAMNMNGTRIGSRTIEVSSITKEKMRDMMRQSRFGQMEASQPHSVCALSDCSCVYARNFPADIKKADVKVFFSIRSISENDISLLEDENGNGIGQVIIRFDSEKTAREAHKLHGKRFLGEKILLTCISRQQMKDILLKSI